MAMYRVLALAVPISVVTQTMAQQPDIPIQQSIEMEEDEQVTTMHKTDSVTILMLLGLLMFTILTVWLFKHRRFRFLHESGLSLIYGMLVGVAIRYASPPSNNDTADGVLVNNSHYTIKNRPDRVYIRLPQSLNTSLLSNKLYRYDLKGEVNSEVNQEPALERAVTFDPELFFNVLLPVIIFEAGYSMKRRHFFRNLGAIMCYAFIGTTISCVVVGGIMYGLTRLMEVQFSLNDCFFFGAIISATDPVTVLAIFNDLNVDVDLYALIFGESVLNDAVAIVLSGSVEKYGQLSQGGFSAEAFFKSLGNFVGIFAGAFAIGSLLGCITALITKFTKIGEHPLLETALFFLMSYSSFQAAEAIGLTGIVAVLFCGVTQAHYTYNNLSSNSKLRTKQLFELLNFLAENFVFLYIGVSIFTFQSQEWHAGFIFSAIFAIVVARFFNIYPLSLLLNIGRKNKLKSSFMHMMMFAGLRGAIAYALSIRNTSNEARKLMVSATMLIVLITVIFCGGLTTPMLQWLQIRVGVEEDQEMSNLASGSSAAKRPRQYSSMESPVNETQPHINDLHHQDDFNTNQQSSPLLEEDGSAPPRKKDKAFFVAKWHNFDIRFMKPLLTNSRPSLIETLPNCCMRIGQILTTEEQLATGDLRIEEDSDTDMIIDHRELSIGEDTNSISTVSQPQFTTADVNKGQTQVNIETNNSPQFDTITTSSTSDDLPLTP